jgi:hypothetical protein
MGTVIRVRAVDAAQPNSPSFAPEEGGVVAGLLARIDAPDVGRRVDRQRIGEAKRMVLLVAALPGKSRPDVALLPCTVTVAERLVEPQDRCNSE